jgi:hypothetical protein
MGKLSPYFVNLSLLGLLSFSAVVAQDQHAFSRHRSFLRRPRLMRL